jgi:hypothetical protein
LKDVQASVTIYQGKYRSVPSGSDVVVNTTDPTQLLIGSGTKQQTLQTDMTLSKVTTAAAADDDSNTAYICYNDNPGSTLCPTGSTGYALGVYQEGGDWYYLTDCTCF